MIKPLLVSLLLLALPAHAATVIVSLNKVKKTEGNIMASLCESEAAYKADKCLKDIVVKAQQGVTLLRFENVLPGCYGVQVMHDKNSNGRMDFNFIGYPKESFAFSNNARPRFSQPGFDKIAFPVALIDVHLSIDLIN
jgi:uncharacterized protein (DUF2141 family)